MDPTPTWWARHHLVLNWRHAYKWVSIQFIAVGVSLQVALLAFPGDIRQYLPDWATHSLALFCLGAAAYGRITTKETPAQQKEGQSNGTPN